MMKCPKCHFSQPEDQYCANCGIDMGLYSPPTRPFFIYLLRTPFFSFLFLSLMMGGATFFIYHRKDDSLQRQIQYLQQGKALKAPKSVKSSPSLSFSRASFNDSMPHYLAQAENAHNMKSENEAESSNLKAYHTLDIKDNGDKGNKKRAKKIADLNPTTKKSLASSENPQLARKDKKKRRLVIQFAEITHDFRQKLTQKSISTGQYETFTDYNAGVIPHKNKPFSMKNSAGLRNLQKVSLPIIPLLQKGKGGEWFFGNFVPEIGLRAGFTVYIELLEYQNKTVKGYIELLRDMKGLERSDLQSTYSLNFELPPHSFLFFVNLMPSNINFSVDQLSYLKHPLFQIFNSSDFKEKNSSLAFIMMNGL